MVTKEQANEIARNITNSLRTINKQYNLGKMYAVGSSTLDSIKDTSEVLEHNGFKMEDSPVIMATCSESGCSKLVRKEGVPDRVILQCMTREIVYGGVNKNIMIISDNPDFKLTMGMLKEKGCKMLIAANWSNSTRDYQLSGDHVFEWEEMKLGTANEITGLGF